MPGLGRALVVAASLLAGCAANDGPPLTFTPDHASLFGHVDVDLAGDLDALGDVVSVSFGDVRAYDLRRDGTRLTVRLQGSPAPGNVDVVVEGTRARSVVHGFHYDAPASGAPLVWAAFGASLTQGAQSNGIDMHSQLQSPAALLARAAGVYLGVPMLADGLLPPLTPSDFDGGCSPRPNSGAGIDTITKTLIDPVTGQMDLRRGRIDWTLVHRNHAIGGARVRDILQGTRGTPAVIAHVVEDPTMDPSDLFSDEQVSAIDRIEQLDPDVAICSDLLANELDPAVAAADDIHPELNTPLEQVQPLLGLLTARLGKLHGQYFFATMPPPSLIGNVAVVRAHRLAAGTDTEASFAAKLAIVDSQADAYNAALAEAIAPYPNLHLVDFAAAARDYVDGIEIGGVRLNLAPFGGIFSLDHLHFSDAGYVLFANELLPAIDAALGLAIPPVSVEDALANDPYSPERLRTAGLVCDAS